MRVVVALASQETTSMTVTSIAETEQLPLPFLKRILAELRRSGILASSRSGESGYRLARPAAAITVAEVFSAVAPLFRVPPVYHEQIQRHESAVDLEEFWAELGAVLRAFLEQTTIADVAKGAQPAVVHRTHNGSSPSSHHTMT
jgi:Rrf2 family protein